MTHSSFDSYSQCLPMVSDRGWHYSVVKLTTLKSYHRQKVLKLKFPSSHNFEIGFTWDNVYIMILEVKVVT